MNRWTGKRRAARAGYSLVEVTLALLVVAIGLTATFALFPEGLRATRAAVDDTEIAMFAEYVFTTLDLTAAKYGGNYGPGWNVGNTDDFMSLMLLDEPAVEPKFQLKDGGGVEAFYWIPDYYGLDPANFPGTDFDADEFRKARFWTSAFTYTLTLGVSTWKGYGSGAPTYAVLQVWPGEYVGNDKPKGEPRIFYREILPVR
jgi:type II secretory pathway pseudopilin PulG